MKRTISRRSWELVGVTASALVLGACGNGSSSGNGLSHDDSDTDIDTAGRLALYSSDNQSVNVLDLDTDTVLQSFALPGGEARLYASPDKRYAVAVQRDDNTVSFIDSGLYTEDHVDHMHDYKEAPAMLDYTLSGIRPTHYSAHDQHGVIFFDAEEGSTSSVTVLSDSDIGGGSVTGELALSNSMHGAAKFIDDHLFVTYKDASITDTVLPAAIERYALTDGTFTLEKRYDEACPLLHGNASNERSLAFGCGDGVLIIDLTQQDYPATKLANPESMAEDGRVGRLYTHPATDVFVGYARGGQTFVIDPKASEVFMELPFSDGVSKVSQGFNADGETYFILGSDGMLYLYDVVADWTPLTPVAVAASVGEEDTAPVVVSSGESDRLYVLNTNGQQVIEVDSLDGSIERVIDLDFSATRMSWHGLPESGDH